MRFLLFLVLFCALAIGDLWDTDDADEEFRGYDPTLPDGGWMDDGTFPRPARQAHHHHHHHHHDDGVALGPIGFLALVMLICGFLCVMFIVGCIVACVRSCKDAVNPQPEAAYTPAAPATSQRSVAPMAQQPPPPPYAQAAPPPPPPPAPSAPPLREQPQVVYQYQVPPPAGFHY